MLTYKEMDNLAAVEIEISERVSTEEFDQTAKKLEAFIARHGRVRVLEIVNHFEGMDVKALWHDLKFSLRHLNDFSRCTIVSDAKFLSLWSAIAEPFLDCQVAYFKPDEVEAARLAALARRGRRRHLKIAGIPSASWQLRSFP